MKAAAIGAVVVSAGALAALPQLPAGTEPAIRSVSEQWPLIVYITVLILGMLWVVYRAWLALDARTAARDDRRTEEFLSSLKSITAEHKESDMRTAGALEGLTTALQTGNQRTQTELLHWRLVVEGLARIQGGDNLAAVEDLVAKRLREALPR